MMKSSNKVSTLLGMALAVGALCVPLNARAQVAANTCTITVKNSTGLAVTLLVNNVPQPLTVSQTVNITAHGGDTFQVQASGSGNLAIQASSPVVLAPICFDHKLNIALIGSKFAIGSPIRQ